MKLAIKLSAILIIGIVVLLSMDAYLAVRRETEFYRTDMEHDAQLLGHAMKDLVADVWKTNGQDRALQLIDDANRREDVVHIRWVWLDRVDDRRYEPRVDRQQLRPAVEGAEVSIRVGNGSGEDKLVTYVPVHVAAGRLGALEMSESMSQLKDYTRTTATRALWLLAILLVAGGGSVLIVGAIAVGRPLHHLVARMRAIGQGDLDTPLRIRRYDELGELAAEINSMCGQLAEARENARLEMKARIAALEQLRHADRLATVGRLASGIAHEVGTPLNVVSARAKQIAVGGLADPDAKTAARIIGEQVARITRTMRQLLDFARPRSGRTTWLTLGKTVRRSVDLLKPFAEKRRVSLHVSAGDEPVMVFANPGQIEQVLTNLVVNAVQAMPQGGNVHVRACRRQTRPPGDSDAPTEDWGCISVSDEGTGIHEEDLGKVFEPFFTTKDVGEGTGLGLSLAYGIVREHGGWIDVTSRLGRGSCFSVYLPLADLAPDGESLKLNPMAGARLAGWTGERSLTGLDRFSQGRRR